MIRDITANQINLSQETSTRAVLALDRRRMGFGKLLKMRRRRRRMRAAKRGRDKGADAVVSLERHVILPHPPMQSRDSVADLTLLARRKEKGTTSLKEVVYFKIAAIPTQKQKRTRSEARGTRILRSDARGPRRLRKRREGWVRNGTEG